jgi:very-short-patch-repair endonuclease
MRVKRDNNLQLRTFARGLRANSTDTERKLWSILRDRQFNGWKFRRQYPVEGYIIDFYCVKARPGIELDGSQHGDPAHVEYDRERDEKLESVGVRLLRFANEDVLKETDAVTQSIWSALNTLRPSPPPSPGVPGEGEREA